MTPNHPGSSIVYYGTSAENYSFAATAELAIQYSAYNYTSGFIHHCTIQDLEVFSHGDFCLFSYFERPLKFVF